MAFTMKQSLVAVPVAVQARAPRAASASKATVCRAQSEETSRRAALGAIFGGAAALFAASAEAKVVVASQFSTGGLSTSTGKAVNSSTSTMEGYDMEGTKKQGITPKRKAKVLAAVKKEAEAVAAKAAPAAAKKK